ncbi:hydroxyectoine utilization dehydratase EutB [Sporolactobacillus shoreicorticis]|uniref:Hydroxyectoine utilization dehydratase EutB n=1 Tax=Sporolactobacillus shoreicorticis TaxID=1923877 RepID=A0ABW5S4D2_9BACL|nr:hydroxyectoine utilization dehydratase EutB [Sporolactobacillus shoreicorticis]MCO7124253.1 hydroxyectoine utilization dehydratase EutB [Sporolactobacillus shoreicorticis]
MKAEMQDSANTKITVQDVWKARKAIAPIVQKTPLLYSPSLSSATQANIYLKCEHLHVSGAFKLRGAVNALAHLSSGQKAHGVTTFSTGNHGIAVATAAKKMGIQATICVSKHVPEAKSQLIQSLGAELKIAGESQDDAEAYCYKLEREQGLAVIPPFDHPDIIAGQGTMALEILEELPDVDCVLAGLSGGGLLSGISLVMKQTNPHIRAIGLSMEKGAAMYQSLCAGKPVITEEYPTLADSLLGGIGNNNQMTFPLIQKYLDDALLIPEVTIAKGMAHLYAHHHMVVEGAGAISTGALLDHQVSVTPSSNIVLVISGCNVDLQEHASAVRPYLNEK